MSVFFLVITWLSQQPVPPEAVLPLQAAAAACAETAMPRLLCRTYHFISSDTSVRGPQYSFVIKKAFSCQTSGLVYCISCRRCPAVYIGETGRTLRQRFGEHLRSIEKNLPGFPVAEHFNRAGHSIDDALVRGMILSVDNAQRKRLEMRLRFNLAPVSRAV